MELLTVPDARLLMEKLRARWSELCKLKVARQRAWYARHPEVDGRMERIHQLQDELGEDCFQRDLTGSDEMLLTEMNLLSDELIALPKCSDGLTESEANELRDVMSQFGKLRRRLPR